MTPEQLAERFPDRFRSFDIYLEYGRRRGDTTIGYRAYEADLAGWLGAEFGKLPDDLVDQARAIYGCRVSDRYKYALSPEAGGSVSS